MKLLFDWSFESDVVNIFEAYQSVAAVAKKIKGQHFFMVDAIENLIILNSESTNNKIRSTFENNIILHPVSLVANLVHPQYQGYNLTSAQVSEVYKFLMDYFTNDGLEQFTHSI